MTDTDADEDVETTEGYEPLWLSVARAFVGVTEFPGPASNPVILRWARAIKAPTWYDGDDKAWCAVFMNRIFLACQLPMAGTGYGLLRAQSFETWGRPLTSPAPGAVLVFTRPSGHHVGLFWAERAPDAYRVLGGNQDNAVGEARMARDRLTAIRWPVEPLRLTTAAEPRL